MATTGPNGWTWASSIRHEGCGLRGRRPHAAINHTAAVEHQPALTAVVWQRASERVESGRIAGRDRSAHHAKSATMEGYDRLPEYAYTVALAAPSLYAQFGPPATRVAMLAALIPSWRTARLTPAEAMR